MGWGGLLQVKTKLTFPVKSNSSLSATPENRTRPPLSFREVAFVITESYTAFFGSHTRLYVQE